MEEYEAISDQFVCGEVVSRMMVAGKPDYFGSTLNRAARIFSAAQPGQVSK